jgi:hypothetical protein
MWARKRTCFRAHLFFEGRFEMASSRYIRMIYGRSSGEVLEVEGEMADQLIATGQASDIDFTEPNALDLSPILDSPATPTGKSTAVGEAIQIGPSPGAAPYARHKRKAR